MREEENVDDVSGRVDVVKNRINVKDWRPTEGKIWRKKEILIWKVVNIDI